MSEINSFSDYASKYNTNMDYSSLFGGGAPYIDNGMGGINVSDYAMIKNGSYGKLMKAYYAKQDADKLSQFGDSSKTLTLMRSSADSLKKSAEVLGDVSLYEKKKFKKKDEETGEEIEVEDYDWDAITKAVKTFVDDYNSVVEQAGNSETKNVLRNAAWMTGITEKAGNLLSKVGITIGKGNKLEFDEEGLKKKTTLGESGIEFDNISTLKSLFTGYGSFASQIEQKASAISSAAARTKGVDQTYNKSGAYSDTLSKLFGSTVDEKVGDKFKDKDTVKDKNKDNNEEYLKSLQKQVPYMKLQIGYGLNTSNDGKVNVVDVNPKLVEKMQNDPKAAKEYTQRLKDVESALKWLDNYKKSVGSTVIVRHDYIDENGNLSHFSVSIRKDEMNERLRKEAQENAEKQIEKTRENARKKAEQIAEKLEEKAEEAKEDGEKIAISEGIQDENEIVKDRAEKLLSEKLENATDGEVYLDNEDMQVIIDAAQNREAVTTNTSSEVGKNFDFKI